MFCALCGSDKKLEIHHLDGNNGNNSQWNRVRLCRTCHVNVHRYFGAATFDEIKKVADEVRKRDPKRFPPTLFD